jgi:hypothetical protein
MTAAVASAALRKTPVQPDSAARFHQADACWLVVVIGTNQAREPFAIRASALVPSTVMENAPDDCARPFHARTSARGVLPQAVGKFVHVYDPRSLGVSKSAMLAGALPPAHPGTLAAPQHVTELNPTNALCGDDVRNAGPKESREMASEAYRDNSGGGSCCHAAQRTRPGIGATAPIRSAASLHDQ